MPFYRVEAQREQYGTFYVEAEDEERAQIAAEDVADEFLCDCDIADDVVVCESVDSVPSGFEFVGPLGWGWVK